MTRNVSKYIHITAMQLFAWSAIRNRKKQVLQQICVHISFWHLTVICERTCAGIILTRNVAILSNWRNIVCHHMNRLQISQRGNLAILFDHINSLQGADLTWSLYKLHTRLHLLGPFEKSFFFLDGESKKSTRFQVSAAISPLKNVILIFMLYTMCTWLTILWCFYM
jgi:hypothetical protein